MGGNILFFIYFVASFLPASDTPDQSSCRTAIPMKRAGDIACEGVLRRERRSDRLGFATADAVDYLSNLSLEKGLRRKPITKLYDSTRLISFDRPWLPTKKCRLHYFEGIEEMMKQIQSGNGDRTRAHEIFGIHSICCIFLAAQ